MKRLTFHGPRQAARPFLYILPLLLIAQTLFGQVDTAVLHNIYLKALDLSEAKKDSILYYANYIQNTPLKSPYPARQVQVLHLYAFYFENKADYRRAIDYYFQTLEEARRMSDVPYEVAALTGLAIVYADDMKQPEKAKSVYQECLELNKKRGDTHALIVTYTNLGAIYYAIKLYDSALYYLQEGLRIGKPLEKERKEDLSTLYNNMGNIWYARKNFDEALVDFRKNYQQDLKSEKPDKRTDLWYDVLNMADCYSEKGWYDSSTKYANLALDLAIQLDSKSKESDSYQILTKLYQHKGDYKKAFQFQRKWYELDTALVNRETYKTTAELEAKFEARQRENEKLLLRAEISQQKLNNRIMTVMAISLSLIALAAALAFVTKRNANRKLRSTNDLVIRQNERLSELNYEKNSLISIVSHDLSTPFASIGMWNQVLKTDQVNLTEEQQKAVRRIEQATSNGEKLIRHILDVEKAQTNQHKVLLENLNLRDLAGSIIEDFQHSAAQKDIRLCLDCPADPIHVLNDRQLLIRILENLLSNAIKYTRPGRNVSLVIREEEDSVHIQVQDEGVGIASDELPYLFSKYSKISSKPTNGEPSTGLGLAIVKRIVEELNGQISCESTPGEGSVFTVLFKK